MCESECESESECECESECESESEYGHVPPASLSTWHRTERWIAVGVTIALSVWLEVTSRAPVKLMEGVVLLRLTGKNFRPTRTRFGARVSTPEEVPTTCHCHRYGT